MDKKENLETGPKIVLQEDACGKRFVDSLELSLDGHLTHIVKSHKCFRQKHEASRKGRFLVPFVSDPYDAQQGVLFQSCII